MRAELRACRARVLQGAQLQNIKEKKKTKTVAHQRSPPAARRAPAACRLPRWRAPRGPTAPAQPAAWRCTYARACAARVEAGAGAGDACGGLVLGSKQQVARLIISAAPLLQGPCRTWLGCARVAARAHHGLTQLTRTPRGPHSHARFRVSWSIAAACAIGYSRVRPKCRRGGGWRAERSAACPRARRRTAGAGAPLVMAYTEPLFRLVGPPATEPIITMLARPGGLCSRSGCASCARAPPGAWAHAGVGAGFAALRAHPRPGVQCRVRHGADLAHAVGGVQVGGHDRAVLLGRVLGGRLADVAAHVVHQDVQGAAEALRDLRAPRGA